MESYYASIINSLNLNRSIDPKLIALKNALDEAYTRINKLEEEKEMIEQENKKIKEESKTLEAKLKSEQTANYMNKCTIRGLNDTIKAQYNTNIDLERKINVMEVRAFVLEGQVSGLKSELLSKEAEVCTLIIEKAELSEAYKDYVNKN